MDKKQRIFIYKIITVICIIATIFLSSLYSNSPQIDQRVIATMLGFDRTEQGITATAHVLTPVTDGKTQFNQSVIMADGKDVFDALNQFSIKLGRKVEFSQCGMIVFGAELTKDGVLDEAQGLFSAGYVSAGIILVATDEMDASEFLCLANELGEESAIGISGFITYFEKTMNMPLVSLVDFLHGNMGESQSFFIPCLDIDKKQSPQDDSSSADSDEGSSEGSEDSGGGGDETSPIVPASEITNTDKIAIFKGGNRVGVIDSAPSKGLILLEPDAFCGTYSIDEFKYDDFEIGNIYGEVVSKRVGFKTEFVDGMPQITYDIKMKIKVLTKHNFVYLFDQNKISESAFYMNLANEFSKKAQYEIGQTIDSSKQLKSDFLNIKYKFYRFNNRQMIEYDKEDNNFLNNVAVKINVNCTIV